MHREIPLLVVILNFLHFWVLMTNIKILCELNLGKIKKKPFGKKESHDAG